MTPDPTTPDTELPQPPREPLDMLAHEYPTTPEDALMAPEDAQDEPEQLRRTLGDKRLNVTHAKAIVDRLRVMEDRFESYRVLLASFGVDESVEVRGLKANLQNTLNDILQAEMCVQSAHSIASEVLDTLESL